MSPVEIGAREIYDLVLQVQAGVQELRQELVGHRERQTDHEARLRTLERGRWPLPSLAVLISAGALLLALLRPGS